PQIATDQSQQPLVAHLSGHAGHQDVVPDVVEHLRRVQIDGDAVARPDISLYLPERSMGETIRPEAEARFRETRIEDRRQDLRDGLLDQPVRDGRYPQRPFAPARFRDQYPAHRLRAVAAITQALANRRPLLARKFGKILNGHAIDSRRTPVGLPPHPRAAQILRREHLLHQCNVQGWLRDPAHAFDSPGRVRHRVRVVHGSSLSIPVRPFAARPLRLLRPRLTSVRSRAQSLAHALSSSFQGAVAHPPPSEWASVRLPSRTANAVRTDLPEKEHEPSVPNRRIYPVRCPLELRHLVLTRPQTEPSMRFLFVGSHLCPPASFGQSLTGLPLPSASGYSDFLGVLHRGLSPHNLMPWPGVHNGMPPTGGCAARG